MASSQHSVMRSVLRGHMQHVWCCMVLCGGAVLFPVSGWLKSFQTIGRRTLGVPAQRGLTARRAAQAARMHARPTRQTHTAPPGTPLMHVHASRSAPSPRLCCWSHRLLRHSHSSALSPTLQRAPPPPQLASCQTRPATWHYKARVLAWRCQLYQPYSPCCGPDVNGLQPRCKATAPIACEQGPWMLLACQLRRSTMSLQHMV